MENGRGFFLAKKNPIEWGFDSLNGVELVTSRGTEGDADFLTIFILAFRFTGCNYPAQ